RHVRLRAADAPGQTWCRLYRRGARVAQKRALHGRLPTARARLPVLHLPEPHTRLPEPPDPPQGNVRTYPPVYSQHHLLDRASARLTPGHSGRQVSPVLRKPAQSFLSTSLTSAASTLSAWSLASIKIGSLSSTTNLGVLGLSSPLSAISSASTSTCPSKLLN